MDEPAGTLAEIGPRSALAVPPRDGPTPFWVYLASLGSDESRRTMRGCLNHIADSLAGVPGEQFGWHELRYEHTVIIRAMIVGEGKSPSFVNKHLSALRGVLREAWRLGLTSAEDFHRAADIRELKGHREPAGRSIHGDEVSAMLGACAADERPAGIRDAALIAFLQSTGARRAEAAGALIERYDPRERSQRIVGKGNKERTVYIHREAVPVLERWLVTIGERRGPVFRPVDQWGNIRPRHMTPRGIGLIIDQRRQEAGLQPLATHDFRRTLGGDFLDAGGDLAQLQKLFGHASATTTAGYDRRPGRELRAAVDRLPILGATGE
jgi:site-specific recombinase XerD